MPSPTCKFTYVGPTYVAISWASLLANAITRDINNCRLKFADHLEQAQLLIQNANGRLVIILYAQIYSQLKIICHFNTASDENF